MNDLLFYAGAEVFEKYGTMSRRTSPAEDVPETFSRSSVASYFDRAGVMRSAEADAVRTEWRDLDSDRIFETPVTLLEAQRRNLWTRSEQFNDSDWAKDGVTITPNDAVAPDGTTTMDKLVENVANARHGLRFGTAQIITAGGDSTVSFFVRAAERTICFLRIESRFTPDNRIQQFFNLSTGTLATLQEGGTTTLNGADIIDYGGGLFRVWASANIGGAVSQIIGGLFVSEADGTTSYFGNNTKGIQGWGGQFEANVVFPSSYIKTVVAIASRTADTLSLEYNEPPQGLTVYVRHIEDGTIGTSGARVLHIGAANSATDPRLWIEADATAKYKASHDNGTATVSSILAAAPEVGDTNELRLVLGEDGSVLIGQSVNAGTESTVGPSAANALGSAWADERVYVNSGGSSDQGFGAYEAIKIARGTRTMTEMRGLAA